jgi:hypothetical protein
MPVPWPSGVLNHAAYVPSFSMGNRFVTRQFGVKRHPSAVSGPQRRMQGATPFRNEGI